MKLVTFLATALAFVAASFAPNLLADTTIYAEQSKLIRANESVTALGPHKHKWQNINGVRLH
jgi:hypothetical protein